MHYIFVYGTLKRGFPNYDAQRLGSFYVSDCATTASYSLVIADQYYIPVLLLDNDNVARGRIIGELYHVDQATLRWLDALEGVGKNRGYQRVEVEVLTKKGDIKIAEAYMKYRHDLDVIHNELSTQYDKDERYIVPSLRER
jgi:gamma-glutamylaminecyclotransferase